MDPANVNWLAVSLAAFSAFLIGGVWYSPILFGKAWMDANGFTEADLEGKVGLIFGGAFALEFVIATNLAFFLGADPGVAWGAGAGALAGVGWVVCAIGVTYLFERKSMKLFAINAGYHALTFTLMGVILGAM